jgi:hypothetical protein
VDARLAHGGLGLLQAARNESERRGVRDEFRLLRVGPAQRGPSWARNSDTFTHLARILI